MSAKNVGGPSDSLDRYYTPSWCVDLFVEHVLPVFDSPKRILEPSAGDGAFVLALRRSFPGSLITAIDIDPSVGPWSDADISYGGDFLDSALPAVDLSVGNPPYSFAEAFCRECLRLGPNLCFLLRLAFYCSGERTEFFQKFPPSIVFALPNRPRFRLDKKSGDSSDYGFFCWISGFEAPTILDRLPPVPIAVRRASENERRKRLGLMW